MKPAYLLPAWCRTAGRVLLCIFLILVLDLATYGKPGDVWITHLIAPKYLNMAAMPMLLLGLIFIGFSPVRQEDEYVARLRTSSFMTSALANSIFMLLAFLAYNVWLFSDTDKSIPWGNVFTFCLQIYVIAILAIYIIIFRTRLWKAAKSMDNEK